MAPLVAVLVGLSWAAGAATPSPAAAAPTVAATVAGRALKITIPAGMCLMDEAQAFDREDLATQRRVDTGKNVVLAGFADCSELRRIRTREIRLLTHFGYVKSSLVGAGAQPVEGVTNAEFVPQAAAYFQKRGLQMIGELQEGFEKKLETARTGLKNGEVRELGLAYKAKEAVGMLMVVRLQFGTETVDRYSVMGLTLVRGVPVAVMIYRQATDASVVPEIAAQSEETMRRLVRLNP